MQRPHRTALEQLLLMLPQHAHRLPLLLVKALRASLVMPAQMPPTLCWPKLMPKEVNLIWRKQGALQRMREG